jgi:hypothetical protein
MNHNIYSQDQQANRTAISGLNQSNNRNHPSGCFKPKQRSFVRRPLVALLTTLLVALIAVVGGQ